MYFQPIKNDDPQLNFYTMYKRETAEFDTEYMQKYNEDLNTTLIFVCSSFPLIAMRADHDPRLVYSPSSAPPSPSPFSPNSSQTEQNVRKRTSGRFSSVSIHPFPPMKALPLPPHGVAHLRRSSQAWIYCTRACSFRYWRRSSRCWASSG